MAKTGKLARVRALAKMKEVVDHYATAAITAKSLFETKTLK